MLEFIVYLTSGKAKVIEAYDLEHAKGLAYKLYGETVDCVMQGMDF